MHFTKLLSLKGVFIMPTSRTQKVNRLRKVMAKIAIYCDVTSPNDLSENLIRKNVYTLLRNQSLWLSLEVFKISVFEPDFILISINSFLLTWLSGFTSFCSN